MRRGGGHAKGSAFEREVCKRLSLYLSGGRRDDLLWRSAMSGGRATVQFAQGKVNLSQSGDITAIAEQAYQFCSQYFVECKHYQDLQIDRAIICQTGSLFNFWTIAVREAHRYGKRPMLIAKQNMFPTILLTEMGHSLFKNPPIAAAHRLGAEIRLFDESTRVSVPMRRRT